MTEQLKLAVTQGRADVVRGFLSTLQGNKDGDLILRQILHEACFDGETLLHLAIHEGQIDCARSLLVAGANPSILDTKGQTAVHVATTPQAVTVFHELLLKNASESRLPELEQLIRAGVGVNFVDTPESRNTPLHWVATFANGETAKCLLAHGAEVNAVNQFGCTALHDAVKNGKVDVVQALLQYGADPYIQADSGISVGKSCFDLAEDKPEILTLLQKPPPLILREDSLESFDKSDLSATTDTMSKLKLTNGTLPHLAAKTDNNRPVTPQLMSPVFKRAPEIEGVMKPPVVVTEEKLGLLWPQPQSIVQLEGAPFSPAAGVLPVYVSVGPATALRKVQKVWTRHSPTLKTLGVQLTVEAQTPLSDLDQPHILCHVNERLCPNRDSYKITIMHHQIRVLCNSCNSVHYAVATLIQLLQFYIGEDGTHVPQLQIDDWAAIPYRGVLFDISQGRVPSVETFKDTVKTLSLLKVNQVHLYTRFRNIDPIIWQICYTKEELSELDEFCRKYSIQLCPVIEVAPTVQYDDIPQLYQEFQDFLTCLTYNEFVSVGPRLSSFLMDVGEDNELNMIECATLLPLRSDQTLQLCGYPLHDIDRNLLLQLPCQLVFNEYGVQATHDYGEFCRPLSKHGVSFFVCPGTAAWNSLAGCPEAAVTNAYNAVKCATREGALGLLICNWSGKGHMTHLPFCWPGFLIGAGLSWNQNSHWEYLLGNIEELMNLHVFRHEKGVVGHAIIELGRAETYLLRCTRGQAGDDCSELPADKGSILYQLLISPDSVQLEHLTADILQRVTRHVRKCQAELKDVQLSCFQGDQILAELHHTCDLMLLSTKLGRGLVQAGRNPAGQTGYATVNMGVANLSATVKTDLANRLLELLEVYQGLWKERYAACDLQVSVAALKGLFKQLVPDSDPTEDVINSPH